VTASDAPKGNQQPSSFARRYAVFTIVAVSVIFAAIFRSAVATRLDGFTLDEAWHIASGAYYVRAQDFRMNPEHPPLVKLWVGGVLANTGIELSPLRTFVDKVDERDFAEQQIYLRNDFAYVQKRARIAMLSLNGILLFALAFALRRTLGPAVAIGSLLFLAIDPTVAAHLPVVMTDLPVALLATTAVVLGIRLFREWSWADVAGCSVALGFAMATKHSGPVFLLIVLCTGLFAAFAGTSEQGRNTPVRGRIAAVGKLAAVALGSLVLLWATYFFRFTESNTRQEVFNRPLAAKIDEVNAPVQRFVLKTMAATHAAPRAYIWGFADTIRVGLQGQAIPLTAFGRPYWKTGPKYFFPGVIVLKLPLGLDCLILMSLILIATKRVRREWRYDIGFLLATLAVFLCVLMSGATYGGVRHALPAIVLLSVIVALCVSEAWDSRGVQVVAVLAFAFAAASALPVARPWEYFNELIGGTQKGYLYFNDEGVDLGQRGQELAAYYHKVLEPANDRPFIMYLISQSELQARHLDFQGGRPAPNGSFSGTLITDARWISKQPFWDNTFLRNTKPSTRFGNLLVYIGDFADATHQLPSVCISKRWVPSIRHSQTSSRRRCC